MPAAPAVPGAAYVPSTVAVSAVVAYSTTVLLKSLSAGFVQCSVTCALPVVAVRDVTVAGDVTSFHIAVYVVSAAGNVSGTAGFHALNASPVFAGVAGAVSSAPSLPVSVTSFVLPPQLPPSALNVSVTVFAFYFRFCRSVSSELHEASDTTAAAASAHIIFAMFFLVISVSSLTFTVYLVTLNFLAFFTLNLSALLTFTLHRIPHSDSSANEVLGVPLHGDNRIDR